MTGKGDLYMSKTLNASAAPETAPSVPVVTDADDDLMAVMTVLQEDEEENESSESPVLDDASLFSRETSIGTKSAQSGGYVVDERGVRLDDVGLFMNASENRIGGTVERVGSNLHYEGVLGDFEYNPGEWAVGVKQISSDGASAEIPVLRYIGTATNGADIVIPDGVTNLDYTFEGNTSLETVPVIPDSVESAHASFMGCENITMASSTAKTGEHEVESDVALGSLAGAGVGVAAGAAAGLKVGAAAGTAVTPGIGTAIGAAGGAIVGAATGAIGGFFLGKDNDGKGGTWVMPENLKDASYMFSGCSKLTEGYKEANDSLINARNMYEGTEKIGTDSYAMSHGSVAVTDFTESKLSKESVQDSYTNTNVEVTPHLTGNYSRDWNEAAGTFDGNNVTQSEKDEIEVLSDLLKKEDVLNGAVESDMSIVTDGLATTAKQKTSTGWKTVTDVNAKNEGSDGLGLDLPGDMAGFLDRAAVSVGEFAILRAVTGNSIIAGVATFGLQATGILPKSMRPILTSVAGLVGEDTPVGAALNDIASKLPDTSNQLGDATVAVADASTKSADDKTVAGTSERIVGSMSDAMDVAAEGQDITKVMASNGRSVALDGVLSSVSAQSDDVSQVKQMSMLCAAGIEEKAAVVAQDGLSQEDKDMLSTGYMQTLQGLKAYDDAAQQAIFEQYGTDSAETEQAMSGLSAVMAGAVAPMYQSIHEIDEAYGFVDDDLAIQLSQLNFTGVGSYDSYEDDVSMYANAGIADEPAVEEAVPAVEVDMQKPDEKRVRESDEDAHYSEMNAYFNEIAEAYEAQHSVSFEMGD